MKITLLIKVSLLILLYLLPFKIFSLDISLTQAAFQYQDTKYLELYFQVIGSTVDYINIGDSKQAEVDFTVLIKKENKIISFDKFSLKSPVSKEIADFIGIRRLKIENGKYSLNVKAVDKHNKENIFEAQNIFEINLSETKICISDIRLLANIFKSEDTNNPFVKNGYYLEPVLFHFIPENIETLGFYFEVYNLDKSGKKYKLNIGIYKGLESEKSDIKLLEQNTSIENAKLTPFLSKIDIKGLESGNYHLSIDLLDDQKNIIYSKYINFQRSNPVEKHFNHYGTNTFKNSFVFNLPIDSLFYSLKALIPIVEAENSIALNNIITSRNVESGRFFLWRYWYKKNKIQPYSVFNKYMKYAKAVDKRFRSQLGYGFETDRGYIYLKYGMPSEIITRESEPTAPPYEIWFYDRIEQNDQRNIKFIFYIPSLAHNDYVLLHTNCRGEKNNPTWFYELYSKRNDSNIRNVRPDQLESFYNELKNSFDNNAVRLWEELK